MTVEKSTWVLSNIRRVSTTNFTWKLVFWPRSPIGEIHVTSIPDCPSCPWSHIRSFLFSPSGKYCAFYHIFLPTPTKMTASNISTTPKPLPTIADYGPNAIEVKDLTFGYSSGGSSIVSRDIKPVLHNLNLTLATGSRCLLIGSNGR